MPGLRGCRRIQVPDIMLARFLLAAAAGREGVSLDMSSGVFIRMSKH